MKYKSTNSGFGYVIRLEKGEKLVESLQSFAEKENITGGFFYGLGAVEDVTIGRYDLEKNKYEFRELESTYELASLNGNVALSGDGVVVHAHGVLGDNNLNAVAGHIKEATVAVTVEIFMHLQHGATMKRMLDDETGLNLLEFE
jgi:predicted DNA-binding protein with PD1-like motif